MVPRMFRTGRSPRHRRYPGVSATGTRRRVVAARQRPNRPQQARSSRSWNRRRSGPILHGSVRSQPSAIRSRLISSRIPSRSSWDRVHRSRCVISPMRTVESRSAGRRSVASGYCEPLSTPYSAFDVPRPAGEAWAEKPRSTRTLRAAAPGIPAVPRPVPGKSPCSAVRSTTTLRSLATAQRPGSGEACSRAPVRCRHERSSSVMRWALRSPRAHLG